MSASAAWARALQAGLRAARPEAPYVGHEDRLCRLSEGMALGDDMAAAHVARLATCFSPPAPWRRASLRAPGQGGSVRGLALAEGLVVAGDEAGRLTAWDVASGALAYQVQAHAPALVRTQASRGRGVSGGVKGLTVVDGEVVTYGGPGRLLGGWVPKRFDLRSGRARGSLPACAAEPYGIAADAAHVLVGMDTAGAAIARLDGKTSRPMGDPATAPRWPMISAGTVALATTRSVHFLGRNPDGRAQDVEAPFFDDAITAATSSGQAVLVGLATGGVELLAVATAPGCDYVLRVHSLRREPEAHVGEVRHVALAPPYAVTADSDGEVALWDVADLTLIAVLRAAGQGQLTALAMDRGRVAAAGADGELHLWELHAPMAD